VSIFTRLNFFAALVAVALVSGVETAAAESQAVTYVSAEAVYVNAGRNAGVTAGLAIEVLRDGVVIATLEVTHVSSHSCACKVVDAAQQVAAGDLVRFDPQALPVRPETKPAPSSSPPPIVVAGRDRSRVRGYASVQGLWIFDDQSTGLSSAQPSLNLRLVVDRLGGTRAAFRLRSRTALYHRGAQINSDAPVNEWTNQLTELAVVVDDPDAPLQMGLGRVVNPFFRGVGLMDGGYVATRVGGYFHVGLAAGMEPDAATSEVRPSRPLAGAFVAYERRQNARYLGSTLALSSSYADGVVSREFVYMQNAASIAGRFSVFQSVEVDFNRQWRMDAEGSRFSFTNFYIMGQLYMTRFALLDVSYDDRNNVRDYRTIETPDSLFERGETRGYTSNLSFFLPRRSSFRVGGGFRYDDAGNETNRFLTLTGRVGRLPWMGHSVVGRFSYSKTPFVSGYRPAFTYQFPIGRRHRFAIGTGAYAYEQGPNRSLNYYGEAMDTYTFGSRYHLTLSARRYVGDDLKSLQAYTELGADF